MNIGKIKKKKRKDKCAVTSMKISLEGVTLSFQMKCMIGVDLFGPVGHCSNFKKLCSWCQR
jgi:hypothetical protein